MGFYGVGSVQYLAHMWATDPNPPPDNYEVFGITSNNPGITAISGKALVLGIVLKY
jgi:hypothetical protein